jgi:hypothetical protein
MALCSQLTPPSIELITSFNYFVNSDRRWSMLLTLSVSRGITDISDSERARSQIKFNWIQLVTNGLIRPILMVSTNTNMEWKLAHKMASKLPPCLCSCTTPSLWAYFSARHIKFHEGTGYESNFAHGIKTFMRKTTNFRSSEKKTLKSGPNLKVFRAWISSFRHQEHGESKWRKTFVANGTCNKTLNPFSNDRKFVVHELGRILFKLMFKLSVLRIFITSSYTRQYLNCARQLPNFENVLEQ